MAAVLSHLHLAWRQKVISTHPYLSICPVYQLGTGFAIFSSENKRRFSGKRENFKV
jgi:hypothetical protein